MKLLQRKKKRVLLLLCMLLLIFGTEQTFAATSKEAEDESYSWTSNYGDGKTHYMLNMPVTDWKSSAPKGSLQGGRVGVDYILQEGAGMGGFVNNPVKFKWSDISPLTMTNSNVWMTKYIDGKPYDYTQYGSGLQNNLSFYRYDGTFYIDPEYDMSGMTFSIIPISESPYAYINVDLYMFVYPMCMKNQINDSNFMNTFVMWSGTQTYWPDSSYFHGVKGQPVYDYVSHPPLVNGVPDKFADWRIYTKMIDANASKAVSYGWNQVKNRKDYDGCWGITIVYAGNGTGYSYRFLVGAEFNPNQILYVGNGATSGSTQTQEQNYGKTVYIKNNWFKRDGYIFTGWNSKGDGSGTSYQPGTPYSSPRPLKLFAQWKRMQYTVTYHGNGATGGATSKQTCNVNQSYNLNANGFTRKGYRFAGWALSPDGAVSYVNGASIYNLSTTNGANIDLYAKWTSNQYTIHFDSNGGTGSMPDMTLAYDEAATLPANGFTRENEYGKSTFIGWNLTPNASDALYKEQEQVINLSELEGAVVTLYAVWDDCPWIEANDLYYTLEQAKSGYITEAELLSHAVASDREDGGPILAGYDEKKQTLFLVLDYQETDFTQFMQDGSVTETYWVQDHAGNVYQKMITVYIVDSKAVPVKPEVTTRFISEKYYNAAYENGGLEENSVWKTNLEYAEVLQSAFSNLRNVMPENVYTFSHEEILKMKEYVKQHGVENRKEPTALQGFCEQFLSR